MPGFHCVHMLLCKQQCHCVGRWVYGNAFMCQICRCGYKDWFDYLPLTYYIESTWKHLFIVFQCHYSGTVFFAVAVSCNVSRLLIAVILCLCLIKRKPLTCLQRSMQLLLMISPAELASLPLVFPTPEYCQYLNWHRNNGTHKWDATGILK